MSAPGSSHLNSVLNVDSPGVLEQQSLQFDEFGEEFLVDHVVSDGNVAYSMETRDGAGGLLEAPGALDNFGGNIPIDGQYYVMDDGMMTDQNGMMAQNNGYILSTEVGNITVTREELMAVGVDVSDPNSINVTAEQEDALLQMLQERGDIFEQNFNEFEYQSPIEYTEGRNEFYQTEEPGPSTSAIQHDGKGEDLYPCFTEDGDLNLVGRNGRRVYTYKREVLLTMGINDVTRLSDGDMANLIRNLNSRINSDTQNAQEHEIFTQAEMPSLFLHKPLTRGISPKHPEMGDGIMGEAVDVIQEDGTSKTAVIRYSRNNGNYKVQFESGQFAWVKDTQVIHKKSKQKLCDIPKKAKKIRYPSEFRGNNIHGPIERPNLMHTTLGFCALCDKKIANARPSFIVIRIPACKCCAESKALLLEDVAHGCKQSAPNMDERTKRKVDEGTTNMREFKVPPAKRFKLNGPKNLLDEDIDPPPDLERVN